MIPVATAQEAVVETNVQNFRVRNCIILYYLEDDTCHVPGGILVATVECRYRSLIVRRCDANPGRYNLVRNSHVSTYTAGAFSGHRKKNKG